MGTVNVADLSAVLFVAFVIALCLVLRKLAYIRGFEAAKREYKKRGSILDAYNSGYNDGYTRGVETERNRKWKN